MNFAKHLEQTVTQKLSKTENELLEKIKATGKTGYSWMWIEKQWEKNAFNGLEGKKLIIQTIRAFVAIIIYAKHHPYILDN